MFKKLKELLFGKTQLPTDDTFEAPGLGILRFNEDVSWWEVDVVKNGETIWFGIAGQENPDQTLVQQAFEILADYSRFRDTVFRFLRSEQLKFKGYEDEISQLTIDQIILSIPQSPTDFMIYFHGPDEFRVWRCDYIAGKPKNLGFDD